MSSAEAPPVQTGARSDITVVPFEGDAHLLAFDTKGRVVGRTETGLGRWTLDGRLEHEVATPDMEEYCTGSFAPDGERFVCVGEASITVTDIETGEIIQRLTPEAVPYGYQRPVWHPDGQRFAIGGSDLSAVDLRDGSVTITPLPLHDPDYTRGVEAYVGDDAILVEHQNQITEYIFGDADLWVGWDHRNYKMYFYRDREPEAFHTIGVAYSTNLHLSPDGRTAYVSRYEQPLLVWDLSTNPPTSAESDVHVHEMDERLELARQPSYDDVAQLLTPDGTPVAAVPWHYRSCASPSYLWTWWGRELVKLSREDLSVLDRVSLPEEVHPSNTGCSDAGVVTSDGDTTWWRVGDRPFDGPLELELYESELLLTADGSAIISVNDDGLVMLRLHAVE